MAPNLVHSPRDGTVSATQNRPGRLGEFDEVTLPAGQRVEARRVRIGDIPLLLGQGEAGMGVALAPAITVARIARAHPELALGVLAPRPLRRRLRLSDAQSPRRRGADRRCPRPRRSADVGSCRSRRPASGNLCLGLVASSAVAAEGIARVIVRLQQFPYERSDLFALPATADGLRFMRGLGFRPVPGHPRSLHHYLRFANRHEPVR